jgi:hypothetical protein
MVLSVRRLRWIAVALLAAMVVAGCSAAVSGPDGNELLTYQRVWPDRTETSTVWPDGRVVMKHGEFLERLTLSAADVQRLRDGLAGDIPVGTAADSPQRLITLPDGSSVEFPRPAAGSITELLDRLMDKHRLDP